MKELEKIVWHQDEPYSGASVFSQWEVMRRAREKGIKVLLTGQGGDETLAGYYKYYPYFLLDLIKDAKFPLFFKTFRHLGKGNGYTKEDALLAMAKIVVSRSLAGIIAPRIKSGMLGKPRFLDAGFAERNRSAEHRLHGSTSSLLDEELEDSLVTSPLPGLLHIDDRNSMAHSIESRPPFLDHRLVEYLFSLPYDMKISDGYTKYILREALRGILPEKIRTRRDKMGFATPMKVWFKGELAGTVSDMLRSAAFRKRGIFDTKEVEYALRLHAGGAKDLSFTIWSWVNLEIWFRLFIDGDRDA
jgi:asparagine synthase (glutamine-hydrolysing)